MIPASEVKIHYLEILATFESKFPELKNQRKYKNSIQRDEALARAGIDLFIASKHKKRVSHAKLTGKSHAKSEKSAPRRLESAGSLPFADTSALNDQDRETTLKVMISASWSSLMHWSEASATLIAAISILQFAFRYTRTPRGKGPFRIENKPVSDEVLKPAGEVIAIMLGDSGEVVS
jgi:hypothetical protein